jgi:putative ABC transport system permease protein
MPFNWDSIARPAMSARGSPIARPAIVQLLTESVVLSFAGGVGGLLFARAAMQVLMVIRPAGLPRVEEAAMDYGVLGFTAGLSLVIGLLFGLMPALQ